MSEDRRPMWEELKERKVVRVGATYAVVAWGVVLGGAELTQILHLPDWVPQLILVLAVLGFPVALVLAWALEVTPDGVRRTDPLVEASGQGRSRLPVLAGVTLAMASVALVMFLVVDGPDPGDGLRDGLDEQRIVVLPFRAEVPPELEHLGGGISELLNIRFAGTRAALQPADPVATAILYEEALSVDPSTAGESVARALGAAMVLSGSVVAGPDGLTLSGTLRDVTTGTRLAAGPVRGPADSTSVMVDRLASEILGVTIGEEDDRLEELTSADPEAVDAYLRGWQEFRSGRLREAFDQFGQAVAIDSTFALASMRMADAANNLSDADEDGALARAWRHRDRLPERDRLYVEARLGPNHPDPSTDREMRRAFRELLEVAPTRANAWYFLAEYALHRPDSRASPERAGESLDRALALEPDNILVLSHQQIVTARLDDAPGYLEATRRLAEIDTTAARQTVYRWVTSVLADDTTRALALYDSLDVPSPTTPWLFMDTPVLLVCEWQAPAIASYLDRLYSETASATEGEVSYHRPFYGFQALGRPDRAREILAELEGVTEEPRAIMRLLGVLYGPLPDSMGAAGADMVEERLAGVGDPAWSAVDVQHRTALELWRIAQGALTHVDHAVAGYWESGADLPDALRRTVELQGLLLEGLALLRRGDADAAGTALDRADALLLEGPPLQPLGGPRGLRTDVYDALVLATAEAYEALGDEEKALAVLERESSFISGHWPFAPRFARDRGRLAALTGDTARAIREYQHYVRMRAAPEPALEAELAEVRASLQALGGR